VTFAAPLGPGLLTNLLVLCDSAGSPYIPADSDGINSDYLGGEASVNPMAGDTVFWESTPYVWRAVTDSDGVWFDQPTDGSFIAYASLTVVSPPEQTVRVLWWADERARVWMDDALFAGALVPGSTDTYGTRRLPLPVGETRFLFKLLGDTGASHFAACFVTEEGDTTHTLGYVLPERHLPADMSVSLTSPVGGEHFHVGDTVHVQWTAGNGIVGVVVKLSVDNGENWIGLGQLGFVGRTDSEWGDWPWVIPDSLYDIQVSAMVALNSTSCLIAAANYFGPEAGISDSAFTISPRAGVLPADARPGRQIPRLTMPHRGLLVVQSTLGNRISVDVYGMRGQLLLRRESTATVTAQLVSGTYVVRVATADGRTLVRRVVSHR
jgi:hypothetical protein